MPNLSTKIINYIMNTSEEEKENLYLEYKKNFYKTYSEDVLKAYAKAEIYNCVFQLEKDYPGYTFKVKDNFNKVDLAFDYKFIRSEHLEIFLPWFIKECKYQFDRKMAYELKYQDNRHHYFLINFTNFQMNSAFTNALYSSGLNKLPAKQLYYNQTEYTLIVLKKMYAQYFTGEVEFTFNPQLFINRPEVTKEIVDYAFILAIKKLAYNIISANYFFNMEESKKLLSLPDADFFLLKDKKPHDRVAYFNDDLLKKYVELAFKKFAELENRYYALHNFTFNKLIKNKDLEKLLIFIQKTSPVNEKMYGKYINDNSWERQSPTQFMQSSIKQNDLSQPQTLTENLKKPELTKQIDDTSLNFATSDNAAKNRAWDNLTVAIRKLDEELAYISSRLNDIQEDNRTYTLDTEKITDPLTTNEKPKDNQDMLEDVNERLKTLISSLPFAETSSIEIKNREKQKVAVLAEAEDEEFEAPVSSRKWTAINYEKRQANLDDEDEKFESDYYQIANELQLIVDSGENKKINFIDDSAFLASEKHDNMHEKNLIDLYDFKAINFFDSEEEQDEQSFQNSSNEQKPKSSKITLKEADLNAIRYLSKKLKTYWIESSKTINPNLKILSNEINEVLNLYNQFTNGNSEMQNNLNFLNEIRRKCIVILRKIKEHNI